MPPNGNPTDCVATSIEPSALPMNASKGQNAYVFGQKRSKAPVAGSMSPTKFPYASRVFRCWSRTSESLGGGKNGSGGVCPKWNSHRPSRSTQGGATGEPSPQTPPVHVSPAVQTCPSSHAAPSADGEHVDGVPVQVKHG